MFNPAEFAPDLVGDQFPIRKAFAAYAKFICEEADAIVMLPGWTNSNGAKCEEALAANCRINRFIYPADWDQLAEG